MILLFELYVIILLTSYFISWRLNDVQKLNYHLKCVEYAEHNLNKILINILAIIKDCAWQDTFTESFKHLKLNTGNIIFRYQVIKFIFDGFIFYFFPHQWPNLGFHLYSKFPIFIAYRHTHTSFLQPFVPINPLHFIGRKFIVVSRPWSSIRRFFVFFAYFSYNTKLKFTIFEMRESFAKKI